MNSKEHIIHCCIRSGLIVSDRSIVSAEFVSKNKAIVLGRDVSEPDAQQYIVTEFYDRGSDSHFIGMPIETGMDIYTARRRYEHLINKERTHASVHSQVR